MKRIMRNILITVLIIITAVPASAATYQLVTANYPINVNGQKIAVQPLNLNGTTYLPLRSISEAVVVPIEWNSAKKSVEINTVDLDRLKEACTLIIASNGETYQQGSGVYVDYDQVLTAYHVVKENRTQIRTTVDQNDQNKMSVVASDSAIDIAALKPSIKIKPVKIGDSDEVKPGDKVIVIASPKGKTDTVAYATVLEPDSRGIVIQCKLGGGASGGAVFNQSGSLIGILIAGDGTTDEVDTKYLVTPINNIREAL